MHNDYFRIFYQFGLVGLLGFVFIFLRATKHNIAVRSGVFAAMFLNSVVYVTPVMIVLFLVLSCGAGAAPISAGQFCRK